MNRSAGTRRVSVASAYVPWSMRLSPPTKPPAAVAIPITWLALASTSSTRTVSEPV